MLFAEYLKSMDWQPDPAYASVIGAKEVYYTTFGRVGEDKIVLSAHHFVMPHGGETWDAWEVEARTEVPGVGCFNFSVHGNSDMEMRSRLSKIADSFSMFLNALYGLDWVRRR